MLFEAVYSTTSNFGGTLLETLVPFVNPIVAGEPYPRVRTRKRATEISLKNAKNKWEKQSEIEFLAGPRSLGRTHPFALQDYDRFFAFKAISDAHSVAVLRRGKNCGFTVDKVCSSYPSAHFF